MCYSLSFFNIAMNQNEYNKDEFFWMNVFSRVNFIIQLAPVLSCYHPLKSCWHPSSSHLAHYHKSDHLRHDNFTLALVLNFALLVLNYAFHEQWTFDRKLRFSKKIINSERSMFSYNCSSRVYKSLFSCLLLFLKMAEPIIVPNGSANDVSSGLVKIQARIATKYRSAVVKGVPNHLQPPKSSVPEKNKRLGIQT